ncbi:Signal transduction histidine kinase [Granulicella pectinivorans]|uniref:histidine kinase n=1 Tax=Granulicella pectinivorans TaxID=474950 RepID=A0A1I6M7W5_9BACT|nr:HAMP domain-containing sensor histidine kinase [Granulicella pectinivorans]SFS11602.1 Signal transduction histidine kinase [Granulicella pectinivorans]
MKKIVWSIVAFFVVVAAVGYAGGYSFLMSANYLPHQFCYLAQPGLVWTNVVMDGLIAASYLAIFLALFWMAFKLRGVEDLRGYLWIFIAFGTFIIACGLTHVMEMVTIWWAVYRVSAAMKVIAALASVPTAVLFIRSAPDLAANIERFMLMLSTTQKEKDQALASLIAAEKLAVAGRISASIAHEIKNPLDTVGNLLYVLRFDPAVPEEALSLIDTAQSEIVRAGHIARSTLSLYRESSAPMPVLLGPLLESVIELQTSDFVKHNIHVQTRVNAPRQMYGYPSELRQILINLLQNAAAAIGANGRILVRVHPANAGYSLTVADTGSGIDAAHRARLFSLFFTTKGEHGTGLGLWLVQSLVEKHGGRIRFRSRTAAESATHGTVFNVWLPLGSPVERPGLTAIASDGGTLSRSR